MPEGQDETWGEQAGGVWGLPDLSAAQYLLETLFEVGPVQSDGLGVGPLSWLEMKSFADATGGISDPWEFRALRRMSEAYIEGFRQGKNPLCIPPADRVSGT